ncbi:MAG: purine-nucleoside phosphorylase, partial [Gemmatimonadota bacterium]
MGIVNSATAVIRQRLQREPRIMLVLGSGLGALADEMEHAVRIPFSEIPGFHASTVEGHKGMLIAGQLEGVDTIGMQGRFHLYEGHSAATAALPIRVMAALGARTLIVTNAAGGVKGDLRSGDIMLINDHINFMFQNPLIGPLIAGDVRFPDMSAPYDAELRALADRVARENGLTLKRGTYFAVMGPSYETPAELRMY